MRSSGETAVNPIRSFLARIVSPAKQATLFLLWLGTTGLCAETLDLTRETWRFHLGDPAGAAEVRFDDTHWQRVSLPHTWNALDAQDGKNRASIVQTSGYRRSPAWYRQTVMVPRHFKRQRTFLRGDGASLVKEAFVNGKPVGRHQGAFTAFCWEITDAVTPGEEALLAIRVDNSEHPTIPLQKLNLEPGRKTLDILPLRGDFNLYGGIYRGLELITKPPLCISPLDMASSGVAVTTPEANAEWARVRVDVAISVANGVGDEAVLSAALRDASGRTVATAERSFAPKDSTRETLEFVVENPRLWNGIEDPYLYTLEVTLTEAGSSVADTVVETIGIRSLTFDPQRGFVLNGRPVKLRGVNRHQDWQDLGWAITRREHEIDFAMIREMGANAVRLAHYPQDPYVLALCDRLGLLVLMELPLVGWINLDEAFTSDAEMQLREMIRQYRNHPSIAIWGLWNELMNGAPEDMASPIPLVTELHAIARAEDPTRPTSGAANDTSERAPGLRNLTDLISWNLYPGWYGERTPDDMVLEIEEKLALDRRPMIGITEYGAGASIFQHEDWSALARPEPRGDWHPEEYQAHFHERTWPAIEKANNVWGSFVWNMFDFAADHRDEGDRPGINDKGLVSHDRQTRKDAFYFYKASWTKEPVVHITSRRFNPRPEGSATIKVYSNADAVRLEIDGRDLGPGSRDGVVHVWKNVDLKPGAIKVDASASNKKTSVTDSVTWTVENKASHSSP
jgi:beta-galactosidase